MFKFEISYSDIKSPDLSATLIILNSMIKDAILSVSNRSIRNRTSLYHQRHRGSVLETRFRSELLSNLNKTFDEHYHLLWKRYDLKDKRVIGFTISDLTANLLRPHFYIYKFDNKKVFSDKETIEQVYRGNEESSLFYFEDEPINSALYTLLIAYRAGDNVKFTIFEDIRILKDGKLPDNVPENIKENLLWWAACPPLLINGKFDIFKFAVLDYDLRHIFGFNNSELLRKIYESFTDWYKWKESIKEQLKKTTSFPIASHSILGLKDDEVYIFQRRDTIPDIAGELIEKGIRDAVLLDSGGSCAIWANWVNSGKGGILNSNFNYRPFRGAVIFVVLEGITSI